MDMLTRIERNWIDNIARGLIRDTEAEIDESRRFRIKRIKPIPDDKKITE